MFRVCNLLLDSTSSNGTHAFECVHDGRYHHHGYECRGEGGGDGQQQLGPPPGTEAREGKRWSARPSSRLR